MPFDLLRSLRAFDVACHERGRQWTAGRFEGCGRKDSFPLARAEGSRGVIEAFSRARASVSESWCGRKDSNLHGIATASPSNWLICCADAN